MKLLAFAQARETFGFSEKEIKLMAGETPRELMARIVPGVSLNGLRVAIDQTFVDWDKPVSEAKEMALLPPVSGG
jgi:molybdopterin synthase sulfur carrier subunit